MESVIYIAIDTERNYENSSLPGSEVYRVLKFIIYHIIVFLTLL